MKEIDYKFIGCINNNSVYDKVKEYESQNYKFNRCVVIGRCLTAYYDDEHKLYYTVDSSD